MLHDFSYGVIPLQKDGEWNVFLIKHHRGHYWGFPKGHAENQESPQETAERELREETGLIISHFWQLPPLEETYSFYHHGQKVEKRVTYFLATVEGAVLLQQEEIEDGKWVAVAQAADYLTFAESKATCRELQRLLGHFESSPHGGIDTQKI